MSAARMRFDIPTLDPFSAVSFYTGVFGCSVRAEAGEGKVALSLEVDSCSFCDPFPVSFSGIAACLPVRGSIPRLLDRISELGGSVIIPGTLVSSDTGYFGLFSDPDGNRLALTSAL